jgi:hypothetical protein
MFPLAPFAGVAAEAPGSGCRAEATGVGYAARPSLFFSGLVCAGEEADIVVSIEEVIGPPPSRACHATPIITSSLER